MPFDRFIQYFRKLYKFIIFTFKTCNAVIPYSTTLVWLLECYSCRFFLIRIVIRTAVETIICLSFRNTFRCFILGGYMTPFTSVFIMYWYVTMFYFHWLNQIKLKKRLQIIYWETQRVAASCFQEKCRGISCNMRTIMALLVSFCNSLVAQDSFIHSFLGDK